MDIKLQPNITGANVNIIKGATQADLTNSVNNSKIYRDEAEAFSIVSEAKSVEASYSALNASISSTTASDKATIATTKANEANNSAINASASEAVCIAKATISTDNANIAIAQATIATNKATEANTSANTANTQANIAITKASEASISAINALTSENNADTSEANALTYRNQAESFANSINPSDLVHISGTETITGNKTFSGTVSGLTKATVGLNNVDNTSDSSKSVNYATTAGTASANDVYAWAKASVKPTYTASEVGLGNVTNESKATMFTNSTLTGTVTLPSTTSIGTISSTELGYIDGVTSNVQGQIDTINTHISGITAYHLLQGNLAVSNSTITQGFNTTLYTGNGSTQSITTGIDMSTQWGNTAEEKFGGLVWMKGRSLATGHNLLDSTRNNFDEVIYTHSTNAGVSANIIDTTSNGFSLGVVSDVNNNGVIYASWNFQTTHRVSGITNHGKPYTCHYNPFTGFTIVKYEGSGIAGHEIPHHLGRKLGFATIKNLSAITDWLAQYREGYSLNLNTTGAEAVATTSISNLNENSIILGNAIWSNASTNSFIMYGWANSYFDKSNKLIGNYEIGVYQGTGASGNKVLTRGKPAWVMIKRLDSADNWYIFDNQRGFTAGVDKLLNPNLSSAEYTAADVLDVNSDGFTLRETSGQNVNGGQYLYMVAYDTNANGGGSYYPLASDTANVQVNNALIPIAQGIDSNGAKNTILSKNETFSGVTYTQGKNYPYYDALGNRGVSNKATNYGTTNPANGGDFYNVLSNKWFTSTGVEITNGRNYLNHIVYADNDGGVLYVEELPKIEYKDIVKANEFKGKNACTAWVNFDGTTTPPTIRDSYNVSAVIRTSTGQYDVYFKEPMDNTNYGIFGTSNNSGSAYGSYVVSGAPTGSANDGKFANKATIGVINTNSLYNPISASIQIMGGKN